MEDILGTDKRNPDTDGDGLTDYEEILLTMTDPLVYNSVSEDFSDANADSDSDGLSNIEEIQLGTNPLSADTDGDGLTDGDEVKIYGTDPLKADTDEDGLSDYDELQIGLDPLNPQTHDVPDAKYVVAQSIDSDSEVFDVINTDDNAYKLSLEIDAPGYVEGNLQATETGYSAVIANDAMIGTAVELGYSLSDSIENARISFEIGEKHRENTLNAFPNEEELQGIKRLNIFKYFEELNMLLPIETKFDIQNNIIYAEVDELGTYCVMDMEMWFESLGIEAEEPQPMSIQTMSVGIDDFSDSVDELECSSSGLPNEILPMPAVALTPQITSTSINRDVLDLVFTIYTNSASAHTLAAEQVERICATAFSESKDVRVYILNHDGTPVVNSYGSTYATNNAVLAEMISSIKYATGTYIPISYALNALYQLNLRAEAHKYYFNIDNSYNVSFGNYPYTTLRSKNISGSVAHGNAISTHLYGRMCSYSGGVWVTNDHDFANPFIKHIYGYIPEIKNCSFEAIVPNGWKTITLDKQLDSKNGVDTDEDNLTDWDEVMNEKLTIAADGTYILPTLQECMGYAEKPYAEAGLDRLFSSHYVNILQAMRTFILPIRSDPTEKDSDGDRLSDINDPMPLSSSNTINQTLSFAGNELVLIQKCLEYLGYLDMYDDKSVHLGYGNFGGLTSSAIKLYQVNHRMHSDASDAKLSNGRIDLVTFYSIILSALQAGYQPSSEYCDTMNVYNAQTYFKHKFTPKSIPMDSVNVSLNPNNEVYIYSTISKLSNSKESIYVYDLTTVLDGVLRYGAQDFHFHYYNCKPGIVENLFYDKATYYNSNNVCARIKKDYVWMISRVMNDAKYDIKLKNNWDSLLKEINAKAKFYHSAFPFKFRDGEINAEMFGNILFGYIGHAGGFARVELEYGGSIYSKLTTGQADNAEDARTILMGFDMYDEVEKDYEYIHITS